MSLPPGTAVSDQPVPLPRTPALPAEAQAFGRYQLIQRLGGGPTAEVWRAVVPGMHGFARVVAIKRVRPEAAQRPEARRTFENEARTTARLHHPNLVETYEFGQVDGLYYLAMEYLDGQNVAQVLEALAPSRQGLPAAVALFVAREVARALGSLHGSADDEGQPLGLVHGDVTPENIVLLRAGAVKLVDLSQARASGSTSDPPSAALVASGYAAPELIEGASFDARADVFSLGVVLWEMLVNRPLFRAATRSETLMNVLQGEVPAPSELVPGVPEALDRVVLGALARDPDRRYPSADALADALEQVMTTLPTRHRDVPAMLSVLFDGVAHVLDQDPTRLQRLDEARPLRSASSEFRAILANEPGFPSDHEPTRAAGAMPMPLESLPSGAIARPSATEPPRPRRLSWIADERLVGVAALALTVAVAGVGGFLRGERVAQPQLAPDMSRVASTVASTVAAANVPTAPAVGRCKSAAPELAYTPGPVAVARPVVAPPPVVASPAVVAPPPVLASPAVVAPPPVLAPPPEVTPRRSAPKLVARTFAEPPRRTVERRSSTRPARQPPTEIHVDPFAE